MSRVYAVTSHKGGTGRSTTTANIAYRLACRGEAVCIVDLDLASPTVGAILELVGYEAGADTGVHDFLPRHAGGAGGIIDPPFAPSQALDYCVSVADYCSSPEVRMDIRAQGGRFDLLPGKREMNENLAEYDVMAPAIEAVLNELVDQYDYIFLDVRSGTDSPLYALTQVRMDLTWMVYYRWTPQHLAGFSRLVSELRDQTGQNQLMGVRTARINPDIYMGTEGYGWFTEQDQRLDQLRRHLFPDDDPTVATIGRDDTLLWKEGILSNVEYGERCADVIRDYEALLGHIVASHR